jgi:hypothetical protein
MNHLTACRYRRKLPVSRMSSDYRPSYRCGSIQKQPSSTKYLDTGMTQLWEHGVTLQHSIPSRCNRLATDCHRWALQVYWPHRTLRFGILFKMQPSLCSTTTCLTGFRHVIRYVKTAKGNPYFCFNSLSYVLIAHGARPELRYFRLSMHNWTRSCFSNNFRSAERICYYGTPLNGPKANQQKGVATSFPLNPSTYTLRIQGIEIYETAYVGHPLSERKIYSVLHRKHAAISVICSVNQNAKSSSLSNALLAWLTIALF